MSHAMSEPAVDATTWSAGAGSAPGDAEEVFVLPTSFAQQRLWFIDQLEPGSPSYNVPLNFRLTGALDVDALERAIGYLVERHEALRTVFDAPDGQPVQVIRQPSPVPLPIVDLRELPEDARAEAAALAVQEEGARPFDIRTGPVFRATVVRLDDAEHLLLLTFHHIAIDGWSVGIVQRELGAAYVAYAAGREPSLPELPIQYADYATWQREFLEGDAIAAQRDYWTTTLAAPLPTLDLPTDRPHRPGRERIAGSTSVELPAAVSAAVTALAREAGTTPFAVLLTAFQLLLHRQSGQDDIIVGSPVAGRTRRETEGVVGFFVNTLALRTRFDGVASFRELLDRVRDTVHGALARQDLPFERIVELVKPARDQSRNPIFQALFSVQSLISSSPLEIPGLGVRRIAGARERAKFDLQLILGESPNGFRGSLEFDADLFDQETAERLARQYVALVAGAVAAPERGLSELPLLDAAERRRLVEEWNDTAVAYPAHATVHDLFVAQAARTPDAVAVRHGDRALTYAEVDAWSTALAHRLRAHDVGPDERVAISMERSLEMVVSVLAVLKAGGAYVPVDPSYPAQRVGHMLGAAAPRVVLTQRRVADRLPPYDTPTVIVDGPPTEPGGPLPDVGVTPDHLAYVIYTSGSTGMPKGVAMPHRPLVNLLAWQRRTSSAGEGSPTLQFASLSFDVSFQEIFATWTTGGTLVLVDDDERRDPERLLRLLVRERVERLFLPYIALQGVADAAVRAADARAVLREVITAGEQLRVTPAVRAWLGRMPGCTLVNQYGPTESHVITALTLDGSPESWPELPAIGRPIDNAVVYVLDANGALAPTGASGELFLGGLALARGYLGAPERTAERFVPDPFRGGEARMYRTGDLARWRSDGILEYIGRTDGQVKIRGHRVELGEVEVALAQCSEVASCAVLAREDAPGERRLVAYVVPATETEFSAARLRAFCRERLPDYMVPATFVRLDALPLTPSGKVDRRSLPSPDAEAVSVAEEYAPPRTTIEHELVHVWESLLSTRPIGIRDDFFELGGHSLLAVRMLHEIERVRGRRLPLAALFQHSTIESIAFLLESTVRSEGEPPVVVLQAEGKQTPYVFVHGDIRGGGWYCRRLAPLLGTDVPLIVLPTLRLGAFGEPLTIEEMAAAHVATLRAVQPAGPYRLGGYCHGGLVALEMACQLRAAGETVERLVVVDTAVPNARFRALEPLLTLATRGAEAPERVARRAALLQRIRYYSGRLRAARRMPPAARVRWLARNVSRRLLGGAAPTAIPVDGIGELAAADWRSREGTQHLEYISRAQSAHMPGRYDGDVDVLWATKLGGNPAPAWERVAARVRVHRIESSHVGMITQHLPTMASTLRECLVRPADR